MDEGRGGLATVAGPQTHCLLLSAVTDKDFMVNRSEDVVLAAHL